MNGLMECLRRKKQTLGRRADDRLPLKQKFSYGVGHVLNDLVANAWFSYLLIYLTKVAELTNSHTGYVAMCGQVTDGICTPIIALLNDRTVCRYGRRKIWHVVGWVAVCVTFPLLFTRAVLPVDTGTVMKLVYYIAVAGVFQFGWGCMQISHLSLIPEISRRDSERVELNAIRFVALTKIFRFSSPQPPIVATKLDTHLCVYIPFLDTLRLPPG